MTSDLARREAAEIDTLIEGKTIVDYFQRNVERWPDEAALHWRRGDEWRRLSWTEYQRMVHEFAAGLQTLGVSPGEFVAIQAGNRPEHVVADLAAIHAGGTGVTIYSTLASSQVQYVAEDCGASVAVLEDLTFMKRWEAIKPELPHLRYVVLLDGADNYSSIDWVLSWEDVIERGRARLAETPGAIDPSAMEPGGVATLIYTSGTTGTPKGVTISHRNVVWTVESVRRTIDLPERPRMVSYLPLAHIAERAATHYLGIYLGGEVWLCPDLAGVLEYIQASRPTLFLGVPRVWEKFYTRLQSRFEEMEGVKGSLVRKAVDLGLRKVDAEQAGGKLVGLSGALHGLLDKVALSKVREQLGLDAVEFSITAAAPITPGLIRFFQAIGIPLYELYGLSETTGPATTNRPDANRIGSVGVPLAGVEVELGPDGEILIRGGVIVDGYYKLPDATEDTFDAEGWLHTGDLGRFDDDGFLYIVGRKKEILITAAGKNVAPAKLETLLGNHSLVSKACMVGDGRKYLSMVIALDAEEAPAWAATRSLEYDDLAGFSRLPQVRAEIERAIDEANQQVSRVEQVKKFFVVPDEWTPESGEITPSLKLKRRVVLDRYSTEIDQLYAETEHGAPQ